MSALIQLISKSHADQLLSWWFRGEGVVLMFHRVLAENQRSRWTGIRGLEVSTEFFSEILDYFTESGFTFLSAADLGRAIVAGECPRRFVTVTFDDGYKDNAEHVGPEMARRRLPWTLYTTTSFPDGQLQPWWYGIGTVLEQCAVLDLSAVGGQKLHLSGLSEGAKDSLYSEVRRIFHGIWGTSDGQTKVRHWFRQHGLHLDEYGRNLAVTWDDLRQLVSMGCDIGAHTVTHPNLVNLTESEASQEISQGANRLRDVLNRPVETLAYPFGDRSAAGPREFELAQKCGFSVAFTTRNGWIFKEHIHNRFCLPRINVSGSFRTFSDFRSRLNGFASLRESGLGRVVTN